MLVPVDTNLPRGEAPQSVAASLVQIAGMYAEVASNQAALAGTEATSHRLGGYINIPSLSTPVGGEYSLTLVNNLITPQYIAVGGFPQVAMLSRDNTGGIVTNAHPPVMSARMELIEHGLDVGHAHWLWVNAGHSPLNGTMIVVWHL